VSTRYPYCYDIAAKLTTLSPWTTTHEQLTDEEKNNSGVTEVSIVDRKLKNNIKLTRQLVKDLIRISVGIEHIDDIIVDFEQSFKAASATTTSGETKAPEVGAKETEAPNAP
jgi:O-acetylhomoserine/O-acetylserine sulfhydrylase